MILYSCDDNIGVCDSSIKSVCYCFLVFQAEDGIRGLVRSGGLEDGYKRQL